jgi:DNA-binding transcriptional regulator YiaG
MQESMCPKCEGDRVVGYLRNGTTKEEETACGQTVTAMVPSLVCSVCSSSFISHNEAVRFDLHVARSLKGIRSGEAFRFTRKALGFGRSQIAESLLVSEEDIRLWEDGKAEPTDIVFAMLNMAVEARLVAMEPLLYSVHHLTTSPSTTNEP